MTKIILQNRQFFIGFCLWLIIGAVLQIFFSQRELIIWVNQHNNLGFDFIFKYGTYLGDGRVVGAMIILLFIFRKKQAGYIALLSFALISGVFLYYLKEFLRTPRPITFFENELQNFHLVHGVEIAEWFSFPSGHTLSAFSIFLVFSFVLKNKNWQYFFVFLAIFVAYSRMYLFQHFAVDVYAGSILGVSFTMIIAYFFERKKANFNVDK
jgi:membrane-associated phospholipid phosphatase